MSAEPRRVECMLDNDARLIAGVGAIISDAAGGAGLSEEGQEDILASAMEACREAFAQLDRQGLSDSALHITVAVLPGRVEADIQYAAAGRQSEACNDRCRVRLVKNCGEAKARTKN